MKRAGLVALALGGLLLTGADDAGPDRAGDRALLGYAQRVVEAHQEADLAAPARAADVLGAALAIEAPAHENAWPLRADLWSRLAEVRLAAGDAKAASDAARAGLAEARDRRDLFTAQLRLRLGEAAERLGSDEEAVEAYAAAIADAKAELLRRKRGTE